MSKVDENEGRPLMEKPQPVPGQEPELQPPPYSSLLGSQSQAYTPVPASAPIQTPYSVQGPQDSMVYNPIANEPPMDQEARAYHNAGPQDHLVCNSTGQPGMGYWKTMGQPLHNTPYVPTTYDPMGNVLPINEVATTDQIVIVSPQSAHSISRARRCGYVKICFAICMILVLISVGLRVFRRSEQREEAAKHRQEAAARRAKRIQSLSVKIDAIQRSMNASIDRNSDWTKVFENDDEYFDFDDFNDEPMTKQLTELQKSISLHRDRRENSKKNKFSGKKNIFTTRKKRIYETKKFIR